ncbi:DUF3325 family protein [Asticcacaulis benevestitus]|uniref:DUF3325 domain-containing protein n=1 Tax=Asticcacaulis benevestitus DSM 16100 = ATCC BAA-896 TaxID=1121022 RepID=V4P965_9CAUL|nr:DUF3325 family protein [Asticcacaulis benevestitus]ESQ81795.1 hypothetical protein ABENE_21465 [Asticcacaulis benevestitus DSM 16100 = ATCC BAA-896]
MSDAFIFLLCLGAFALLLAAMSRHQQEWFGAKLARPLSLSLRAGGFGLLFAAWLVAGFTVGFAYGTVVWCGCIAVAALVVIAVNINRDRLLKYLRR